MKTKITQNDLLRFIYRETTDTENDRILLAIENDWSLKEQFELLLSDYAALEKVKFQPSKNCIDAILQYSRKTASVGSHY